MLKITETRSVPIYKGEKENAVNERELHSFLKVKRDFSTWIKSQLENVSAIQNIDYYVNSIKNNWQILIEYTLSIDITKEICMGAGTSPRANKETKGLSKQTIKYFLETQKNIKQ